LSTFLLLATAHAHDDPTWPTHLADRSDWTLEGEDLVSPALDDLGSRVATIVTIRDDEAPPALFARGLRGGETGAWVPLEETHREGEHRVLVADLDPTAPLAPFDQVQLRLGLPDDARVEELRWEALVPRFPNAGRRSREASAPVYAAFAAALPAELVTIGVVSRGQWGARATGCSSVEDDWYRMAIHHTAGGQTSGGTVEGAVRTTQAYMMDSGDYCDLAYQFMVGYDGSLYEARPYGYYSGATGGNNDGNAASCFLGCYHPEPSCPTSHPDTDEMIWGAQLLVQTFTELHNIGTTDQDIRGHQDWPGNSTACPGDFVMARLDEIRADLAWFEATETDRSETDFVLAPGAQATVSVTLRNDGGLAWEPGETALGTTGPRDDDSPLADASWLADNRAATVASTVARGEEGTFTFTVTAPDRVGTYTTTLGLVAEGITWFEDAPWGGGPADDLVTVTVEVVEDGETPPPPEDTGEAPTDTDLPEPDGFVAPARVALEPRGCGCDAAGGVVPWVWVALVPWWVRRKRA
jgi:hypothetical protein